MNVLEKKGYKKKHYVILLSIFSMVWFFSLANIVNAHSGRTDSSGGHTCRTNCSSYGLDYGEYHYHGGSVISTPPPPPQTWSFEGKTYYSYSAYLQAQEDYEIEQERIEQEELIQQQEEENQRLQDELEELKKQQEISESNEDTGIVAGITDTDESSNSGSGVAVSLGTLAILGGGGWYLNRRKKRRVAINSSSEKTD